MFTFNDETKEALEQISKEFRGMARNRVNFHKVDFPYMESISCLLHNIATMNAPFSGIEDYCKRIVEGANQGASIWTRKLTELTEEHDEKKND